MAAVGACTCPERSNGTDGNARAPRHLERRTEVTVYQRLLSNGALKFFVENGVLSLRRPEPVEGSKEGRGR